MQIRDLQEAATKASIPGSKLLSHILDNWPPPPSSRHLSPIAIRRLACAAAVPPSPSSLARQIQYRARLNSAVMVRTLYCFILFPGCLYYTARPTSPSPFHPSSSTEGKENQNKIGRPGIIRGIRGRREGMLGSGARKVMRGFVHFEMCVLYLSTRCSFWFLVDVDDLELSTMCVSYYNRLISIFW